jgi:hypothetical protein
MPDDDAPMTSGLYYLTLALFAGVGLLATLSVLVWMVALNPR